MRSAAQACLRALALDLQGCKNSRLWHRCAQTIVQTQQRKPSSKAAVLSVHVTKSPSSPKSQLLPAGPCTSCIEIRGSQTHTLRQTAHYRRRHIKCEEVEKRSVFDGESREEKREKKTDPQTRPCLFSGWRCQKPPTMSLQSRPADLTPAGSDVMMESWRREGAHPPRHTHSFDE